MGYWRDVGKGTLQYILVGLIAAVAGIIYYSIAGWPSE